MDYLKKKIHSINRIIEHLGKEIKIQIVVTCSIDNIGRRYESKGTFLDNRATKQTIKNALWDETIYLIHFLEALGFPENYVIEKMNEFIEEEINK